MRVECFLSSPENEKAILTTEVFDLPELPQVNDRVDLSGWFDLEKLNDQEVNLLQEDAIVIDRFWYKANNEVILQIFCQPNPSSSV